MTGGWKTTQEIPRLTWKCTEPCRKTTFLLARGFVRFHISWWQGLTPTCTHADLHSVWVCLCVRVGDTFKITWLPFSLKRALSHKNTPRGWCKGKSTGELSLWGAKSGNFNTHSHEFIAQASPSWPFLSGASGSNHVNCPSAWASGRFSARRWGPRGRGSR